jgi:ankyrin repeat protein
MAADCLRCGCHCNRWEVQDAITYGIVLCECQKLHYSHRADVDGQDDRDYHAMPNGKFVKADTVRLLIKHGVDVTGKDETKTTPLHLASSLGSAEMVRLLIEHSSDVNAQDEHHMTISKLG